MRRAQPSLSCSPKLTRCLPPCGPSQFRCGIANLRARQTRELVIGAENDLKEQSDRVLRAFRERYGRVPRLFQAPGRINIVGEHTDYNGGFVMPAAIDRRCVVAMARNGGRYLNIVSANLRAEVRVSLDDLTPRRDWSDYVAGVAASLIKAGISVEGCDLWIGSGVPLGAGVSSSAALEVAAAWALIATSGASARSTEIAPTDIALLAQEAENAFVGMPCGIMDQFASANGVADHALILDCRALAWRAVPLPAEYCFLLIDSMVRHTHTTGEYRRRREECEAAARLLDVAQLRDVTETDLLEALPKLPAVASRRCRHVVTENARVLRAAKCLEDGDVAGLGRAMNASHESLRDDMEVSIAAVDTLVAIAHGTAGVVGARMMGGGFGGSVVALVEAATADAARREIAARYGAHIGQVPDAFVCRAVAGAGEIAS